MAHMNSRQMRQITRSRYEEILDRIAKALRVKPAVNPLKERLAYMKHLADSDYEGLSEMLRCLSDAEEDRM